MRVCFKLYSGRPALFAERAVQKEVTPSSCDIWLWCALLDILRYMRIWKSVWFRDRERERDDTTPKGIIFCDKGGEDWNISLVAVLVAGEKDSRRDMVLNRL